MKNILLWGLVLAGFGYGVNVQAQTSDSASAKAKVSVKRRIQIVKVKDLQFSDAVQGDASETISPSDATGHNSEFTVTGREGATFSVDLPDNGTVIMATGQGNSPQTQIPVDNFASNFGADGATGTITGETKLTVGATRAPIRGDQSEGDYEATFNVTVAYQ